MKKLITTCSILLLSCGINIYAQLWLKQITNTTAAINQIEFIDDSIGWALPYYFNVQSDFHILRTTDGGNRWEKIIYNPQEVQFKEFQFFSPTIGYARGKNKFYKTTDGGYNWSIIHSVIDDNKMWDYPSTSMSFVNKDIGYISYFFSIYKTTDAGNSWNLILADQSSSTLKVAFSDADHGWVTKGIERNLYKTSDGGNTWIAIRDHSKPICQIDPNFGYAYDYWNNGEIFKTTDGGDNWKSITNGYLIAYKFDKYVGFLSRSQNAIDHTVDGGETWSSIVTKIVPDLVIQSFGFYGKDIWLGGTEGQIYKMNLKPDLELKSLVNMETLFVGDEVNIIWNAHNIDTNDLCKIEYSQNNGVAWNIIADSIKTKSENYNWKLKNTLVTSTTCKVRITSYGTGAITQNQNPFRIYVSAHIIVSKIPTNQYYSPGFQLPIKWNADYLSSSKVTFEIYITPDTNITKPSLLGTYANTNNLTDNSGKIIIPNRTTFCKVRVKDSNSPLIYGETNYFRIRQASELHFTAPTATHIWPADSIRQITLNIVNIRKIDISFSSDAGSTWAIINSIEIIDSLEAHEIKIGWKVPRVESDVCLIKFESTNPSNIPPVVSSVFSVTQKLIIGEFPLSPNNCWFYKTTGGRYPDYGYDGSHYSYTNIYYIIVTLDEKIMDDLQKYYPFAIYEWNSSSNDIRKFSYTNTIYYRKKGNQIFKYGTLEPWLDFEYPYGSIDVFGNNKRTFLHGTEFISWDLVADGIGLIQPFSFSQNFRSGQYEKNEIAGAVINGIAYGEVLKNFIVTSIEKDNTQLPQEFSLSQNYPNPFNPTTTIKYSIPVETRHASSLQNVTLKVYDMLGREISTLVNETKSPGSYEVKFNGASLPSGIYFYRMQCGSFTETKKIVLMK